MTSQEAAAKEASRYITADTRFPQFLPYPIFLLDMDISMTAKATYALLLNRSHLSQMNRWEDDHGWVYIVYPIRSVASDMHKSCSSIKSAFRELEHMELLERQHLSAGKASHLYAKIPANCETHADSDRKQSLCRSGNDPPDGQISDHEDGRFSVREEGGFPSPNKNKESTDTKKQDRDKRKAAHGRYRNIFLSDSEYQALLADYPEDLDRYLEECSCYLAAAGRSYMNYEAGIRSWALKDQKKKRYAIHHKEYKCTEEDTL